MAFVTHNLSILTLVFLLFLNESLRGKVATASGFDDSTSDHTSSTAQSILSATFYPLELMKKASLCVIKSPWIFLTATNALLPQANASILGQLNVLESFGLSKYWDTTTCTGRAMNAIHKQNFWKQKKVCQGAGLPYTGHFAFSTHFSYADDPLVRAYIDHRVLRAEKCFAPFCQIYAHDRCPQEKSWWQWVLHLSPCDEELCLGRFIPDEEQEVTRGIFKSLKTIGHQIIKQCQQRFNFQNAHH